MSESTRLPAAERRSPARRRSTRRALLRLGIGAPALALGLVVPATTAWAANSSTVHVSAHGFDSATCGQRSNPCRTITQGVHRAGRGGSVDVGPGTYHEQVVVSHQLALHGASAVIDATGLQSGRGAMLNAAALLLTKSAGGSSVEGFTVRGAYGEGILVAGAAHVRIAGNTVTGNDRGTPANTRYAECLPQGDVPGDCGEGLHLMSTTDSQVVANRVTRNAGGILVTDELGAATRNQIVGNVARDNATDCGITLPGHNPKALSARGTRQPRTAGVHHNLVKGNTVINNGARGEGAGVLIAAAGPGMAAYDNTVVGNTIRGNGMPGITVHSHTPNQDVSGNVFTRNDIGPNNLHGDSDARVSVTTGILVFSATVPTSETVRANHVHGNRIPVYASKNVTLHK
jgi:nitrous oxidase accessory protein NosD